MLRSYLNKNLVEAGCDEAGRGCLAGPVFAAAVILPKDFEHPLLNDSKQLTHDERMLLRPVVERNAIAWAVAKVSHSQIDKINILNASFRAMHRAVRQLQMKPQCLLIDGNRFKKFRGIEHHCIIDGDAKFASIAAASILAKTYRDEHMEQLHNRYPEYGWLTNKGYPTPEHREAILTHGICPHHRKTFGLVAQQFQGALELEG